MVMCALSVWGIGSMTKVHKIELFIVDGENYGIDEVVSTIQEQEICGSFPTVMGTKTVTVKWSDEHPLNQTKSCVEAARELFKD